MNASTHAAETRADALPTGAVRIGARTAARFVAGAAVVALVVTGCGDGDVGDEVDGSASDAVADVATPSDGADPSTTEPAGQPTTDAPIAPASPTPSPTEPPTQEPPSPQPSPTATGLPGRPYDHLYIDEGDVLGVVGVAHDDALNVRARPTLGAPILTTAAPTEYGLVATGRSREVDDRYWHEVTVRDVTGWVSSRYVSFIGPTWDDTSRFVDLHGRLQGDTIAALGREVASHYESTDEVVSRVVISVAPSLGDIAEVTYDVVGIPDDAGLGYRLHVFARPDEGGQGFTLVTLEVTDLCLRGGTPDHRCP